MAKINRREFLKYARKVAVGLALAGLPGCSGKENLEAKLTEANKIIRDFPEEIPGAGKVEKYEVKGAKHCLVMIPQMHYSIGNKTAEEISREITDPKMLDYLLSVIRNKWDLTNAVQRDIYEITDSLRETTNVTEVRAEGVSEEYTNEEFKEFYKNHLIGLLAESYVKLEEMDEHMEEYKFAPGAHILMGMQGKMRILPGESEELNRLAEKNSKQSINHPSIFNDREDFFLRMCSQTENPIVMGIYGKTHDFKDNIEKWNLQNPDKKFSLIEVTPKSYRGTK